MNKADFLSACVTDLCGTPYLHYVKGNYKYQSRNNMIYQTGICPPEDIVTDLVVLRRDGWMWIGKYFAWDGCSGPTWDDRRNAKAGQGHDGEFFLLRQGLLPMEFFGAANQFLRDQMIRDGCSASRANMYKWAVDNFAHYAAKPSHAKKIIIAP